MKRGLTIDQLLRPLDECQVQAYLNDTLQVADVLEWVLAQFGPSRVCQASFSISEEFLRRLFFIKKKHRIVDYSLLLDLKATNKTLKLWRFIHQVVDKAYLSANHGKLLLVEGENGRVCSVITSQNLTRGNRYECAIVTTKKKFLKLCKNPLIR